MRTKSDGAWVLPQYEQWMGQAATDEEREQLRAARDAWLRRFKLDAPEAEKPARRYNMTPEGRAAKREKMRDYWQKRKATRAGAAAAGPDGVTDERSGC